MTPLWHYTQHQLCVSTMLPNPRRKRAVNAVTEYCYILTECTQTGFFQVAYKKKGNFVKVALMAFELQLTSIYWPNVTNIHSIPRIIDRILMFITVCTKVLSGTNSIQLVACMIHFLFSPPPHLHLTFGQVFLYIFCAPTGATNLVVSWKTPQIQQSQNKINKVMRLMFHK
jgi:hypothetical protein